ncbi:MAG: hypothetical protein DU480_10250 [Nitrosomonas sp.]|uniref:hypothetical protein n=1 Tax=Nitrosomonas sp. TaxID=42353 RepID=UPI0032EB1CF9
MDKAAYVLLGVVLGVILNAIKEWWFQRGKNRKELEYLAIRISCMLDTFAYEASNVVADDGLCEGRQGSDGCRSIQVEKPIFDPLSIEVEWKSLPTELMYEVLNFPNLVEAANHRISAAFMFSALPPDYEEGFEERQFQYAGLGLKAHALSEKLRRIGNLPSMSTPESEEWNPIQCMQEKVAEIKNVRERRAAKHRALMEKLESNSDKTKSSSRDER